MKQVAGTLRLDLAQFRELAAFAQFGSDLDKSTLAQIERGKRMVELLKQGQYAPLAVEDQIIVLFAGANAYLDDVPVESVGKFEEEVLSYVRERGAEIRKEIKEKKVIDDSTKEKLVKLLTEFKTTFQARV
jgi:F-type H+-transporting ATPase subunit alpha